jgi:integrase/recombinase XerC
MTGDKLTHRIITLSGPRARGGEKGGGKGGLEGGLDPGRGGFGPGTGASAPDHVDSALDFFTPQKAQAQNFFYPLETWLEAFLVDRKVRGLSPKTLSFYRSKLTNFLAFAQARALDQVVQVTPGEVRLWLLSLEEGHTPGGVMCFYRALKAFLSWFLDEADPGGWKSPMDKVKPPKVPEHVLDPVDRDTFRALLKVCPRGQLTGDRDRAIFLVLLYTWARAQELLDLDLEDVDTVTGQVLIRRGKGSKSRTVFLGKKTRREVRAYLRHRGLGPGPLFQKDEGGRLDYQGLRFVVKRRAEKAGVQAPALHSFRRAFALEMLRNGVDIFMLQALMGHADLGVLRRYLKYVTRDLAQAHQRGGPVDNWE